MTEYPKVGDTLSYTRKDESVVSGVVVAIYAKTPGIRTSMWTPGGAVWDHPGNENETVAYRLELSPEDSARVGHPVTVGASRVMWDVYVKDKGLV